MTPEEEKKALDAILTEAHQVHGKSLKALAYFKVSDHAVSEDLVQNTFTKTWKYLVKGGKIETMRAFLFHTLKNLIIDEYRKPKNSSLDILIEKGFDLKSQEIDRNIDMLDGRKVFLLIKKMPKKYQEILQLRYTEDLSIEEISIKTKKSKNTVAVQIHRGLKKLKLLYKDKFED